MKRRRFLCALAGLACTPLARATDWSRISAAEASQALRESLGEGARVAISRLGMENGYFGNPKLKIGLHKNLAKAEGLMRRLGLGKQLDDFVLAMNRTAEAAAPQALAVVLDAVQRMSVVDAKAIIAGGDGAATAWFRRNTEALLTEKLLPIVQGVAGKSGLVRSYNTLSARLEKITGATGDLAKVEDYVTRKALQGIYTLIAEEERAIRAQPLNYAGSLIGKVFGSLD